MPPSTAQWHLGPRVVLSLQIAACMLAKGRNVELGEAQDQHEDQCIVERKRDTAYRQRRRNSETGEES